MTAVIPMSSGWLRVYHQLPVPARQVVVRLRGSYLRRWRYGSETDRLVAEALRRESWRPEQWRQWQDEQLARVLSHAATHVPYYKEMWSTRRMHGDHRSVELLANWPLLEKDAVRAQPRAFLVNGAATRSMLEEHTSGSTGKPLDLWWSRAAVRSIYALNEAYCNHWYGVSRRDNWAMLGGQLVVPARQTTPPFWMWNPPLNQLYMSSYHLAHRLIPAYCDALVEHRVRYVAGYTSSLYQLALGVLDHGRRDLHMAVAFTHAEPVTAQQREAISSAFNCQVCETYGNAEAVSRASACRSGRLHLWPQVGVVEIVDGLRGVPDGESGEMLSTGLQNMDMPLIRYRIGDRATVADPALPCDCGRALPVLASVDGRAEDALITRDGRVVQRLHAVPIGVPTVREVQIVQETLERVCIRIVPAPGFGDAARTQLAEQLRDRLGDVEVVFDIVDQIPREPNGKFRAVVCKLSHAERESLRAAKTA